MNNLKVIQFIEQLEQELPVVEWKADTTEVWPLIRLALAFELYHAQYYPDGGAPLLKSGVPIPAALSLPAKLKAGVKRMFQRRALQQELTAMSAKHEVFVLGFTSNRASVGAKRYDRVHDVLTTWCHDAGRKPLVLEFTNGVPYSETPWLPELRVRGDGLLWRWQQTAAAPEFTLHLPGYAQFCARVREHFPQAQSFMIDREVLHFRIARFLSAVRFFERLLRAGNYRLCLLSTYYDWRGMALTVAANRLGIATVDLQHGSRNAGHVAYASWTTIPANGWESLPRWFWCWNAFSAQPIANWNTTLRHRHDVLFGGNPWISSWKERRFPLTAEQETTIAAIAGKRNLLYTLQPFDELRIPGVLELIGRLPSDWHWWLRLHPRQSPKVIAEMQQQLAAFPHVRWFANEVGDLPLPLLLLHTDVHFTMWSSVVEEAAEFGVPTVFTDVNGVLLFKEYINRGSAHDGTGGDLAALVQQLAEEKVAPSEQQGDYVKALRQVLGEK